ncbi:hypothetical protein KXD40_004205 [Peronospora effusa]|uniref:Uncharacterized protein n=1 Tax=Peronospora effusa TaxID=542832 RepID=A0A3M6VDA2_9STRA|nr:hypothetical protein DD238_006707 [Peronospora effusa]RQM09913.1 hypothetical protein DD237_007037 [Peronospora effusa]UIZ28050.1 hypothetical protein KXD40_004205 [Peronospora effusa]
MAVESVVRLLDVLKLMLVEDSVPLMEVGSAVRSQDVPRLIKEEVNVELMAVRDDVVDGIVGSRLEVPRDSALIMVDQETGALAQRYWNNVRDVFKKSKADSSKTDADWAK